MGWRLNCSTSRRTKHREVRRVFFAQMVMRFPGLRSLSGCLVVCLSVVLTGCTTSRTTQTTTPLVDLQNGASISLHVVQQSGNSEPVSGPLALWKTKDGYVKTLVTLVPAPGSPTPVVRLDTSAPRFSADGNRCWLLSSNAPIASFDYDAGVAILGPHGQPDWAKPDQ